MSVLNLLGNITVSGGHANGDIVSNDFENVVGSEYGDTITGNADKNVLIGLGGNDKLNGGPQDTLIGGAGNDELSGGYRFIGGAGKDFMSVSSATSSNNVGLFIYESENDSTPTATDGLIFFLGVPGEHTKIDLSRIDANQTDVNDGVNQQFIFGGDFTAGHLVLAYSPSGGNAIMGNIDGDAAPEFMFEYASLTHRQLLVAGDFIL
ncbi:hypothetical protein LB462_26315 [Phyllobacterium sp. KW56]|nr:hypothetical protein [Phyllobacterium sp. KW56]